MTHRSIPEHRIKTVSVRLMVNSQQSEEETLRLASEMMGQSIAEKLFEFNKVVRSEEFSGLMQFTVELDVIVPETPTCNRPTEKQESTSG